MAPSGRGPNGWRGGEAGPAVAGALPSPAFAATVRLVPTTASSRLLAWYDRDRRTLPWRAPPGVRPDPYHVWLSEIMLQQTRVEAVVPRFELFLARFPDLATLAAAPVAEVMAAWAGLGYYARARALHRAAQALAARGFPRNAAGLRELPGVGTYTAAAIAAIAFGEPVAAVDGNVERILARRHAITTPLPAARAEIAEHAAALMEQPAARARAGDFVQALFDLGATICTPRALACPTCPWRGGCAGRAAGRAEALPARAAKPLRPERRGVHFWLTDAAGNVLLRTRPPTGLLGGMAELPGTPWRAAPWTPNDALAHAPMAAAWREIGTIRHGFTHFRLEIRLFAAHLARFAPPAGCYLRPIAALGAEALPSVMRKCVAASVAPRPVPLLGPSGAPAGA